VSNTSSGHIHQHPLNFLPGILPSVIHRRAVFSSTPAHSASSGTLQISRWGSEDGGRRGLMISESTLRQDAEENEEFGSNWAYEILNFPGR